MRFASLPACLITLAFTAAPAAGVAGCKLYKVAELPVTMSGLQPLVSARINGADAVFVLDSGAFYSMISGAAAQRYGLKLRSAPKDLDLVGLGGGVDASITTVDELTVANQVIRNIEFGVNRREPGGGAVGLLGQNILAGVDAEYDLARGVVRLMRPEDCWRDVLAYWVKSEPFSILELYDPGLQTQPASATAYLNGYKVKVIFDTGAHSSLVTRKVAEHVGGFTPTSPDVVSAGVGHGMGPQGYHQWIAPFETFKIGREEHRNVRLRVVDTALILGAHMLLGADFFLSHHVYVANSRQRLYLTYNGGPVFTPESSVEKPEAEPPSQAPSKGDSQ